MTSKEFRVPYQDMIRLLDALNDLTHYEVTTAKRKKELIEDIHHAVDAINHPINVFELGDVEQVPDNVVELKKKMNNPSSDLFFD